MKAIKASGTKNSFIIVDLISPAAHAEFNNLFLNDKSAFVEKFCFGRLGHNADGVLFLMPSPESNYHFQWQFYNRDGSIAEMCGNAARCATLYYSSNHNQEEVKMLTLAGSVTGRMINNEPAVEMPEVKSSPKQIKIVSAGGGIIGYSVNTGVPHFVTFVDNFFVEKSPQRDELRRLCASLRSNPEFGSEGTNVTLIKLNTVDPLEVITFERGVEDFTQSCGTGAVAAALVAKLLGTVTPEVVSIKVPGGHLKVDLVNQTKPILSGETQIEYEINLLGGK